MFVVNQKMNEKTKKLVRALFKEMYIHMTRDGKNTVKYILKTFKGELYTIEVKIKNETKRKKTN